MEKTKIDLPNWFTGQVYESGDTVSNPFTGESIELTAEELSMYDLIHGAQIAVTMGMVLDYEECYSIMEKGGDWFLANNPSAYMILLD